MTTPNTPSDPTTPAEPDNLREEPSFTLLLMGHNGPSTHPLPLRGVLNLGRDESADVRIEHSSVSRTHALLEVDGPRFSIRDVGSVNGVRVRGRRIEVGAVVSFGPGEIVDVGKTSLVVVSRAVAPTDHGPSRPPPSPDGMVLAHPSMLRLYEIVDRVAASPMNVLVVGETGVGKELLTEALHRGSTRADKPIIRVNCAALSPTLIESELFGHERGAFTGATAAHIGLLEAADGGTLFLDEVGELPLALQPKLLRVLEDGLVRRLGALQQRAINVRVVAATHRDLRTDVVNGAFRRDLYYRLNGITLAVPPLRERKSEIARLAAHFLATATPPHTDALAPEVIAALESHDWPGNIRELRNVVLRAAVLAGSAPISVGVLPDEIIARLPTPVALAPPSSPSGLRDEITALERRRITDALARTHGNQTQAAALLGMPRRTLVARLRQYNLDRPDDPNRKP